MKASAHWLGILVLTTSLAATAATPPEENLPGAAPAADSLLPYRNSHPRLERAIRRQLFRDEYIGMQALIEALAIREGMTILDIGAGPGYASFLFAEKLGGSGEVLATDVREDFVDYIREEGERRGLNNLAAVRVQPDGLDPVYASRRYDLVLLSNVYHCIDQRLEYFSRLRELLNDGARLVLVMYNQAPLFVEKDFIRLDDLADVLRAEAPSSPFLAGLSDSTNDLLAKRSDAEELKRALLEDFNRMLQNPWFYKNFYHDSYFDKDLFAPAERDAANWLLMALGEAGALGVPFASIPPRDARALLQLNRLFFIKRFGEHLAQGGRGAYIPAGDANRHISKYVMLRELDAAGYALSEELKLSAYYDALIVVPRAP